MRQIHQKLQQRRRRGKNHEDGDEDPEQIDDEEKKDDLVQEMTETLKAIDAMDMLSDANLPDFDVQPPPMTSTTTTASTASTATKEPDVVEDDDIADLSDVKDEDIMGYIVDNEEEIQIRDEIWQELNQDWIIKQEQKQKELEELIAQGKEIPSKRRRKREAKKDAESAAEAAAEALMKSSRIDYNSLQRLFAPFEENDQEKRDGGEEAENQWEEAEEAEEGEEEETSVVNILGQNRDDDDE